MEPSIDWTKFDAECRKAYDVPSSAWIRSVPPSLTEVRLGESLAPLASATDEGAQHLVRGPDGVAFVGGAEAARRRLWEIAATAPRPPAAPSPKPRRRAA